MICKRILALVVLVGLASLPAMADTITYQFTSDHCSPTSTGCSGNGINNPNLQNPVVMGTVKLMDIGGAGSGEVSVTVQLASGFQFVSTGAGTGNSGDASFFFNMTSAATIEITNIVPSASWTIPNVSGIPLDHQAAGQYAGDGLSDQFNHGLTCSGCGNGGSNPVPPPLTFDVTLAGLTAANFAAAPQFAADVISPNGATGLIDASGGGSNQQSTVPEPGSLLLLGTGLIGLVGWSRRKAKV